MLNSSWRRGLAAAGLALTVLAGAVTGAHASTATVGATAYQQVKGWGSFPSYFRTDWSSTHQFDIFNKPAVQDAIYAMGLTHIRVDVEPRLYVSGTQLSDIVLDTNSLNDLVNQIQIARNHGVTQYIMSCWSPPAVWKDNGNINQGHLIPADEPFFVNYYTKVIQTLNARGVGLPVAISVQNEPDTAPNYDSCIYSDTQANINLWYQLVIDMKNSFNANGCGSVLVFGPECTNTDNDNMFLGRDNYPILSSNTALNTAMGAYATHGYGECYWTPMISGMASHPKDAWITEWSIYNSQFGTTESDYTMATFRHMNSNFVDLPFNYWTAWIQWTLDGSYVGGDQTPTYSERYWICQKLWTTVKPSQNWVVHHMTCDDGNYITQNTQNIPWPPPTTCDTMVDLVDYRKGDGTQDCVVLCNNTTGTTTTMVVNGLAGGTYTDYMSDATHNMTVNGSGSVSGGACTVTLPPKSVSILITGGGAPTVPPAPTNLTATAAPGQIALNWTASPGATSYGVSRSTISGSGYASVATGLAATTYTNTGLNNGTTYYFVATATNTAGTSGNSAQASAVPSATVQINCGGSAVSPFAADAFFSAGNSGNNWTGAVDTSAVTSPAPQAVYQTERYGDFNYTLSGFTVGSTSTVRLHFTEDYVTAAGQRVFNVSINGTNVLTNFDIFAVAGAQHKANIQSFTAAANASGQYIIAFTSVTNNAKVDAIEIIPAATPPATPTGLTTTPGNAQVVLNWSAASGATSYNLYRGTSAGGESPTAIVTGIAGITYTNTGLTNGTAYFYKVAAVNTAGTSGQSNEAAATPTAPAPPPAPTGLTATAGNAQVALSWSTSTGATSYNVKRSTVTGTGYVTVAGPAVTNYTNTGLTNGTTYYFVVSAVNGNGESANSTQASATPTTGVPGAPTGLAASSGSTQVTLTWNATANTTSYNLYRGTTAGGENATAIVTGIATTSYTNTGLTNGTAYYYKIKAVNASGTSAYSNEASATPQTSVAINAGGPAAGSFIADADFSGGNTATNYTGTIDTSGLTSPAPQAVYQSERYGTMTYTVPGLTASGAYKVRLHFCENYFTVSGGRTFNVSVGGTQVLTNFDVYAAAGAAHKGVIKEYNTTANASGQVIVTLTTVVNNALLNAIEVQPIAGTPPAAPTNLTATPGNAQVTLNWTASTGATSYNVYRGSTSGGEGVAPIVTGIGSTSYICTGETNGQTYYFKVTAVNVAGESTNSNEAGAAPQAPPAAPAGVTATAGNTQATVSWSTSTGATSYNVKRSTVNGSGYATVGSPTTTSFVNTGLTNGTTYYYVVTAVNIGGESANSAQVSATPTSGTGGGTSINIDFVGGSATNGNPSAMASTESAGVISADHWNSETGAAQATGQALTDNAGAASGATVTWTSNNTWSTTITEAAGNARMMKGYLDTSNTSTTTVNIAGLGSTYTTNGYDVYVYCDGDSPATRTGSYTIGTTTITNTDTAGANYNGTFTLGNGASGNYVKFTNLSSASFTLSAVGGAASDGNPRAPINGIQIVSHPPSGNTHAGTWACKAVLGASPSYTKISEVVSVAANTNYVASYWIKGTGTLQLDVLNGSWGTEISPAINTAATGTWQQVSTPVFNTGANTQLTFIIQDFVGGAAGTAYIDDAFLGVSAGTNMLNNGGFEGGNTGWNVAGVFSIVQNP